MYFEWQTAPTADFAVIGNPVSHSLSPRMHQAIYDTLHLNYRYVALRVDQGDVSAALNYLSEIGYTGVNVTVPHKREVLHWSKTVDPFAAEVRAANTVNLKTRGCINTDAPGFLKTLEAFNFPQKTALVLGAGGSAWALVAALSSQGWKVHVYNRTASKAEELAARYHARCVSSPDPRGAYLLLNATSSAFDGIGPPVEWSHCEREAVAYDLMYAKDSTPFLRDATRQGLKTVDGLPLLVAQGALSFEWWTGLQAPIPAMEDALRGAP
jgi:shikimate dehydrogenase